MRAIVAAAMLLLGAVVAGQSAGVRPGVAAAATPRATTTPLVQNPEGNPNRPLTNLPSTNLSGVGPNAAPGLAFFETAKDGVVVRVQTLATPAPSMVAEIDKGTCPNGGSRLYALKRFAGNASITTLRGVNLNQIRKPGVVIRIVRGGKTIDCGNALTPDLLKTRG
jgi:hypothetical protein